MADNTLAAIVSNNKETEKKLDQQTTLLTHILKTQQDELKLDKAEAKQAARDRKEAKRRSSDKGLTGILKKGEEKKKKGFLGSLMNGILGAIGGLFKGGLGSFLTKLGLGAALVGGITALFTNKELREALGNALFGKDGLFGENNLNRLTEALFGKDGFFGAKNLDEMYKGIKAWFVEDAPWKVTMREGIVDFFVKDAEWKKDIRNGFKMMIDGLKSIVASAVNWVGEKLGFGNLSRGMQDEQNRQRANFGLAPIQNNRADERARAVEIYNESGRTEQTGEYLRQINAVAKLEQKKANLELQVSQQEKNITKLKDPKFIADGKANLAKTQAKLAKVINDLAYAEKKMLENRTLLSGTYEGLQTGGFVGTVPNQGGNGDRFKTSVSPGSVVLNQTASGMFQQGGQVPVMLEQGEKVFGPRDPMAGHALMMNSLIPRFQTGGVVATDGHPQTGPGYTITGERDANGRPLVFSKGGAEAWSKMMKESGGQVKSRDVNSAKRSTSHNTTVGGVSNSNHLYGNGVDVQTGSSSWNWMRNQGKSSQYGWHWNDYLGPQGWHWDYTGKNKDSNMNEGNEDGIANMMTSTLQGVQNVASSLFNFGGVGTAAGELLGAIGTAFKNVFGDIFGDIGGILGGNNAGPGSSGPATPLTGDAASSAKQMHDYVVSLGYSAAQAKGIVANIQRESNFDPKVRSGDDGGPGGLFQWKGGRQTAEVARLVNSGDWQGQIRYALQEDVGPRYKSETAGMSALDASMWWAKYWERPASLENARNKHSQFIPSYGFQNGGVANIRGQSNATTNSMVAKSQDQLAQKIAAAVTPVVIPMGGGGSPTIQQPGNDTTMPDLSSQDSSVVAMEYKYRITMGASV